MLAQDDGGDRAAVRDARLARRFLAIGHELTTFSKLERCMRDSAAAYTQQITCFAGIQWLRSRQH